MPVVNDIHRPDINGIPPKMAKIASMFSESLNAPFLQVTTDDNLCSSVDIRGAFQKREEWPGNIFQNAKYFIFKVSPPGRYYQEGDKVTAELIGRHYKGRKFRKYTGTPVQVIAKIKQWIEAEIV